MIIFISYKRWIIWASLMIIYIIGCIHRVSPAVIAKELMVEFKTTGTVLGVLSSIYFYIYAIMQIPSGILSDTVGPRKTVTIGTIVMGIGTIIFSLAQSLIICLIGRFLIGLGVSVVMVNAMRVCVEWFKPNEMGLVNGLITTVGALGSMLAATPLAILSERLGWRMSFVFIGVISFFFAWLCWFIVRNKPSDCISNNSSIEPQSKKNIFSTLQNIRDGVIVVFKNPYTWPPFFGFFSFYSTLMAFSGLWGIPFLSQVYGFSIKEAANYMMVVSFGLLIGCPLIGYVSDKILVRRRTPYIAFAFAYAIIWGLIYFLTIKKAPGIFLYIINFLMGFFSSGFTLSLVSSKEVNMHFLAGIAMGTTNTGGFLGAAILQIILGKVLDFFWGGVSIGSVRIYPTEAYQVAFFICFLVTLGGLFASLFIKETYCKTAY